MKKSNTFIGSVKSAVAFALLWMCTLSTMAENNRVYIEDFTIIPGETKTVSVLMDNETPIASLQFDVQLPEGLSLVSNSITKNPARITRSSHAVAATPRLGEGYYRFTVLANSTLEYNGTIPGTEGELFTFNVTAADNYQGGRIYMNEIVGVDNTDTKNPVEVVMPDCGVLVTLYAGTLFTDVDAIELVDDEPSLVNVLLNNVVVAVGLQADLILPEGVSMVENEEGELFGYTDRLSDNVLIVKNPLAEGNGYRILISSLTNDEFEGAEGTLFSFLIKGSQDIPENAAIELKNVVVSTKDGNAFPVDCVSCIAVSHKVSFAKEDVNRDGVVNVNDVFAVINVINSADFEDAADVNGDGTVNVNDIFAVISVVE